MRIRNNRNYGRRRINEEYDQEYIDNLIRDIKYIIDKKYFLLGRRLYASEYRVSSNRYGETEVIFPVTIGGYRERTGLKTSDEQNAAFYISDKLKELGYSDIVVYPTKRLGDWNRFTMHVAIDADGDKVYG